ncbi:MAG: Ldh family oxidoreductase [Dehalococcoidia bacterium]|nr:Ldh family oxidoreductase [Dehalococcoidia bacterium]
MPLVPAAALTDYIARIFEATGAPSDEASRIAEHLAGANLRGHDSHGVIRTPAYVVMAGAGTLKPGAAHRIVRDSASTALLDGGWNYGQIAAYHATNLAITKARETGIGWVSACNSGHIGRVGAYGEQIVAAGMIAFGGVNSPGTRLTAAFGGAHRRLGTSPIMIAMPGPTPGEPFVLDMATSVIAEGKVRVAVNRGTQLKPQLIIDGNGHPTTEPHDFYGTGTNAKQGALLPVGGDTAGHKGFGLNIAMEALSGILSGAGTSVEGQRGSNGVFIMALDPERFVEANVFVSMITALVGFVKEPPYAPGVAEILVAGEPERRTMADRLAQGVPLDDETWKQIADAAASVGVPTLEV